MLKSIALIASVACFALLGLAARKLEEAVSCKSKLDSFGSKAYRKGR
jgi:hypothetical protein